MVVVFLPSLWSDCPIWFCNYINWLTLEFDMDNQNEETLENILADNFAEYHCKYDYSKTDPNAGSSLIFETAEAYTYFLLKWA